MVGSEIVHTFCILTATNTEDKWGQKVFSFKRPTAFP